MIWIYICFKWYQWILAKLNAFCSSTLSSNLTNLLQQTTGLYTCKRCYFTCHHVRAGTLITVGLVLYGYQVPDDLHYSFGLCCAAVVFAFITSALLTADARAPRRCHSSKAVHHVSHGTKNAHVAYTCSVIDGPTCHVNLPGPSSMSSNEPYTKLWLILERPVHCDVTDPLTKRTLRCVWSLNDPYTALCLIIERNVHCAVTDPWTTRTLRCDWSLTPGHTYRNISSQVSSEFVIAV